MYYWHKTPKIIQKILYSLCWRVSTKKNQIYLTFDDGPIPQVTPWILETLEKFNAKATFFCVGENIKKYPELFKSILQQNHSVGNHTQNHLNGWQTNTQQYLQNIEMCQEEIEKYHKQQKAKLFRPPYGKIKPQQIKKLQAKNYKIIMWDVLTGDFDPQKKPQQILQKTKKITSPGSIIVMHDNIKSEETLLYLLPRLLEYYQKNNFQCETFR